MVNLIEKAMREVRASVLSAMGACVAEGVLSGEVAENFVVEIPADTSHGDFATNAALVSAKTFRMAPARVAKEICDRISPDDTYFEKPTVAGPGFINFKVKPRWFSEVLLGVQEAGEDYGRSEVGGGQRVMVEFVSANPTGPMHMGNARGGALGDSMAAALDFVGYDVTREFYVNDAGNQVAKLGASLEARYIQALKGEDAVPFPEDGYQGDDIKEHAQKFIQEYGDIYLEKGGEERRKALCDYVLPQNIAKLKADLESYRIHYDVWFHESALHKQDAIMAVVELLKKSGHTYEQEGALWYKSTDFGEEKDDVLVRANGVPTYFAADIAYHYNKFVERGFDKVINVWGADHHGHVARLKHAMEGIGVDPGRLDIVLMQLVNLVQDGQVVRMSKRTGKAVTLNDLLEEVPVDAARFFFNLREPSSHFDFDLDLAVEQNSENPVYYVQYAHARICSILKNLAAEGIQPRDCGLEELSLLSAPEEQELIRYLAVLPNELIDAATYYDPAKLTRYCVELATKFHKFYNACRVKGEEESLMQARLALCIATRRVLRNVLELLKITAPESM